MRRRFKRKPLAWLINAPTGGSEQITHACAMAALFVLYQLIQNAGILEFTPKYQGVIIRIIASVAFLRSSQVQAYYCDSLRLAQVQAY